MKFVIGCLLVSCAIVYHARSQRYQDVPEIVTEKSVTMIDPTTKAETIKYYMDKTSGVLDTFTGKQYLISDVLENRIIVVDYVAGKGRMYDIVTDTSATIGDKEVERLRQKISKYEQEKKEDMAKAILGNR